MQPSSNPYSEPTNQHSQVQVYTVLQLHPNCCPHPDIPTAMLLSIIRYSNHPNRHQWHKCQHAIKPCPVMPPPRFAICLAQGKPPPKQCPPTLTVEKQLMLQHHAGSVSARGRRSHGVSRSVRAITSSAEDPTRCGAKGMSV